MAYEQFGVVKVLVLTINAFFFFASWYSYYNHTPYGNQKDIETHLKIEGRCMQFLLPSEDILIFTNTDWGGHVIEGGNPSGRSHGERIMLVWYIVHYISFNKFDYY